MPAFARFHAHPCPDSQLSLPLYSNRTPMGFPESSEDFSEQRIDLSTHLVRRSEHTVVVQVQGAGLCQQGISDGDLLVIDRQLIARPGDTVIAAIGGEAHVRQLIQLKGLHYLQALSPDEAPLAIAGEHDVSVWGVVCHVIHSLR